MSFISRVWPDESTSRTGFPRVSTTAWIFVNGPPRERPILGPPFFAAPEAIVASIGEFHFTRLARRKHEPYGAPPGGQRLRGSS